ncbi:MAG: YybS family protein [Beijerinckiaceae bacterium]|nr:YybS family protein [Beijerinckiaceae bacterium]
MNTPVSSSKPFMQAIFASLGAGIASALLVAVVQPQSVFGLLLFLIAPLPLVVTGFSYHPLVAALGALFGCLFLDVFIMPTLSLAYALIAGIPAWLICEAGMRRGARLAFLRDPLGYFTPGVVLMGIAAYVSALIFTGALWISPTYDGLRAYLYSAFEETVRSQYQIDPKNGLRLPDGTDLEPLGRIYSRAIPSLMALPFFLMSVLSGYLGAKVAQISQRLPRPWPDFRLTRLPAIALFALALGVGLIFLGGFAGLAGELISLTLGLCFLLQGLAVIHWRVRERQGLRWLISASWAVLIIFGLSAFAFAALGIIDHIFDLRRTRGPDITPNA